MMVVDGLLGGKLYVTSINDSQHMKGSKHETGDAWDFRLPSRLPLGGMQKPDAAWTADIQAVLDAEFDIVLEKDHVHVEYDPKG
jgi:hypothetical protein